MAARTIDQLLETMLGHLLLRDAQHVATIEQLTERLDAAIRELDALKTTQSEVKRDG